MFEIPCRKGLQALTAATKAIIPTVTLGVARAVDETRLSVLYSHPQGMGQFVLPSSEVTAELLPGAQDFRQANVRSISSDLPGAIDWYLRAGGVQRVVSFRISQSEPASCFWIGLSDPSPLTDDQLTRLEAVAETSAALLNPPLTPDDHAQRLRRLEFAARLLPGLLRVLDVHEVFDRLTTTAKQVLPHDLLILTLFNEDLSNFTALARSDGDSDLGAVIPSTYPAAVTRAWEFDLIDDHTVYPLELDTLGSKLGARSSLRFPIRFDGRVIGGVAFISFKCAAYGDIDVPVGRRLADHAAVALSHYMLAKRFAEQAGRAEELQARTTNIDLLDELLAAFIDSGELPDVFGRFSSITRKVLPHDAAVLMVRLPDGIHARVHASSGFPFKLPETTEVPRELLQNPDWDHDIFDDLSHMTEQPYSGIAKAGFLSLLRVPIRFDGRFAGALVFLSGASSAFSHADIPVARRIADRIAVTLARDRVIEASKRADEATERAAKLEARVRALTDELDASTGYRRVVGESTQWRRVLTQATQVASNPTTVLLLGESGTGKEVVARFVHRASPRNGGPFVALNCAALPEQLLEAELFGYERGAFTGATQSKPGQLEQATTGTLFLDEVAEMSPSAQAKFLRVLQEREFQRLGGTRVLRTDARIIAATNRDLETAIAQGQFREDLYYRLNVFAIQLPPLRDRRDDILPLSQAFLAELSQRFGRPPSGVSREARQMLLEHHWPGNVRELRNSLERAAILCEGGLITPEHLPIKTAPRTPVSRPVENVSIESIPAGDLHSVERKLIEQALQAARFNKSKAAKALGLTRQQLYLRMRRYGLDQEPSKA
jgi:transcriptional regulator with GAF, ATPase, and Fis domain